MPELIAVGGRGCDRPAFYPVAREIGALPKETHGTQRSVLSDPRHEPEAGLGPLSYKKPATAGTGRAGLGANADGTNAIIKPLFRCSRERALYLARAHPGTGSEHNFSLWNLPECSFRASGKVKDAARRGSQYLGHEYSFRRALGRPSRRPFYCAPGNLLDRIEPSRFALRRGRLQLGLQEVSSARAKSFQRASEPHLGFVRMRAQANESLVDQGRSHEHALGSRRPGHLPFRQAVEHHGVCRGRVVRNCQFGSVRNRTQSLIVKATRRAGRTHLSARRTLPLRARCAAMKRHGNSGGSRGRPRYPFEGYGEHCRGLGRVEPFTSA